MMFVCANLSFGKEDYEMKKILCFILILAGVLGVILLASLGAAEGDVGSDYGLKLTATADKEEYEKDEEISLVVAVDNNNYYTIENITATLTLPKELEAVDDKLSVSDITVKAGDGYKLEFKLKVKNDFLLYAIYGGAGALGAMIILAIVSILVKIKKKKALAATLAVFMVLTASPLWIFAAEKEDESEGQSLSLSAEKTVTVDGKEYTVEIKLDIPVNKYMKDTDGDGAPDYLEEYFGSSVKDKDTDSDGVDDYTEICVLGTDPLAPDGDKDSDGDGLANADETTIYGTSPLKADSDYDGVSDYDEVMVYNTDPLNANTDGDAVSDGDELRLGLDPLLKDDISAMTQTLGEDSIDEVLRVDNDAIPSVTGTSSAVLDRNVFITEATGDAIRDNRSVIGKGIALDIGCEAELELSFELAEVKNTAAIMRLDEEEGWILEETTLEGNVVKASVNHSGTYCVADLSILLPMLGIDAKGYYNDIMSLVGGEEGESYSLSVKSSVDAVNANRNAAEGEIKTLTFASTPIFAVPVDTESRGSSLELGIGTVMGQADIVFAIDTTGSMGDEIANVADNIIAFTHELTTVYNVNVNFALVDYRDITADGAESTYVVNNGTSNWYADTEEFKSVISSLYVSGGGDIPETVVDALEMARNLDYRVTSSKFIILLTDADHKSDNNYGISSMEEEIMLLKNSGIVVSVVTDSYYEYAYTGLYTETGGIYANIYGDFYEELLGLADIIGADVNEKNWILLDNFQYVSLNEPLSITSGDTDGDGKSDFAELRAPVEKDVTGFVKLYLNMNGVPEKMVEEYFLSSDGVKITVYPFTSNPGLPDTDFDGIGDAIDKKPRSNSFTGVWDADEYVTNSDYRYSIDFRDFFSNKYAYNESLARTSLFLSSIIYDDQGFDYNESVDYTSKRGTKSISKLTDIDELLNIHMSDAVEVDLNLKYGDDHVTEVGLAHHTVTYNGITKQIFAIVIRGTGDSVEEWSSNFSLGDRNNIEWANKYNHYGFDVTAKRVEEEIINYMVDYATGIDTVYWIMGHSRGAAVANIIAADFIDAGGNVYAYTFATPNTTVSPYANETRYGSIFNVVNEDDFVPCLPLSQWGFEHYGKTAEIDMTSAMESEWHALGDDTWWYNQMSEDNLNSLIDNFFSVAATWDDCYRYTCSHDHGDGTRDDITEYLGGSYNYSVRAKRYCIITTKSTIIGKQSEACQLPAFFMQVLAEAMASESAADVIMGYELADRYEAMRLPLTKAMLGGLTDPHLCETYHIILGHMANGDFGW